MNGYYLIQGNGWNLLMEIVIYNDQLWKFIDNSYYFKKISFLWLTYLDLYFLNIKVAPNYTKKLILKGIDTITLLEKEVT